MLLFIHCATNGSVEFQNIAIQCLADMLCCHKDILGPTQPTADDIKIEDTDNPQPNEFIKPFMKAFMNSLRSRNPYISQNTCTAICKLLLYNVLQDDLAAEFVRQLTLMYYDPDTEVGDGPLERKRYRTALTQILTYSLPRFCLKSLSTANLMADLVVPIIQKLVLKKEELDEVEEGDEMTSWSTITNQLAEWTDPRGAFINGEKPRPGRPLPAPAEDPHVKLAINILERANSTSSSREEKKPLLMLLGKLNVASPALFLATGDSRSSEEPKTEAKTETDIEVLTHLHELATDAVEDKQGPDAATRASIAKVEMVIAKKLGEHEQEESEQTIRPAERADDVETASQAGQMEQEEEDAQSQVQGEGQEEEEEDTMLAGMHAEGTRMPLEEEDEEDDDDDTVTDGSAGRANARRSKSRTTVTESNIVDSLLESEME